MQLCNCVVRVGGSLLNTVPKMGVSPAEIMILRRLHGEDAVVDIRPTKVEKRNQGREWDRLAEIYDRASSFSSAPGEENRPMLEKMFPGAIRKLPTTLKEIGLGHLMSPASIAAAKAAEGAPADTEEAEESSVFDYQVPPADAEGGDGGDGTDVDTQEND